MHVGIMSDLEIFLSRLVKCSMESGRKRQAGRARIGGRQERERLSEGGKRRGQDQEGGTGEGQRQTSNEEEGKLRIERRRSGSDSEQASAGRPRAQGRAEERRRNWAGQSSGQQAGHTTRGPNQGKARGSRRKGRNGGGETKPGPMERREKQRDKGQGATGAGGRRGHRNRRGKKLTRRSSLSAGPEAQGAMAGPRVSFPAARLLGAEPPPLAEGGDSGGREGRGVIRLAVPRQHREGQGARARRRGPARKGARGDKRRKRAEGEARGEREAYYRIGRPREGREEEEETRNQGPQGGV
nr:hypothetical protein Iba_chr15bCG11390 [Ipomoea batatas]